MAEFVTLTLPGIGSSSLLGYLKGIGLLTILGRQDDPSTAACWDRDGFVLRSRHDMASLETFFLERFEPAPVVSPWNGGSGFYPKDSTVGFDAIEASADPRLARFKAAIAASRTAIRDAGLTDKPEPKTAKPALLRALRATLPDDALEWLDAAVVFAGGELRYPPVLGSGGNDGRYDVANNYAQCVAEVLGLTGARDVTATLRAALGAAPSALRKMSLAHLTRDASPVNSPGGESDALGNPWDLVLAVTGTTVLAPAATRRSGGSGAMVAPFTLRPTGAGYGSAVGGEKGRAEIWMPTWSRPARLSEVRAMLREGRVQLRRREATTALDAVQAVGELGVARGLDGFERFAILERAGQSNLSVPAGRVAVRPNPAASALSTLEPWLERIVRHGSADAPARQRIAVRALERAAYSLGADGSPRNAINLLVAVGETEVACAISGMTRVKPLRADAEPWLRLIGDEDAATRLAVTFASLADPRRDGATPSSAAARTLRGALVGRSETYAANEGWSAPREAPIVTQLAAVHERRARGEAGEFAYGLPARLADLRRLVHGGLDERRLAALLRGLVVLDWRHVRAPPVETPAGAVDPVLSHLALAFHDPRHGHELRVVPRPDWVARLRAGRVADVIGEAHLRLRLGGLVPIAEARDLRAGAADGERLAAALLARPSAREMHGLVRAMTTHDQQEDDVDP